jgi:hypothetical protein
MTANIPGRCPSVPADWKTVLLVRVITFKERKIRDMLKGLKGVCPVNY